MSKRHLTRAEKSYRKWRIIYLLCVAVWAVFIVWILFMDLPSSSGADVPVPEEQVTVQIIPEIEPEPVVEAVEVVFDPVRDDIPMDAEHQRLLYQACGETGIRYELALAVVWKETDFRNIIGDGGESYGYMQVQEKHHRDRMNRLGVTDLSDSYSNFLVGCDYLAELIEKDKGLEWALMAYNGGPSYANDMVRAGNVSQYATEVVGHFELLEVGVSAE